MFGRCKHLFVFIHCSAAGPFPTLPSGRKRNEETKKEAKEVQVNNQSNVKKGVLEQTRNDERNIRNQVIPPLLREHEMQMRGPPAMPPQALQQLADGAVVRDRVADGPYAAEPEPAVGVGDHDAPLAGRPPVRVLHVVVAAAVRLPDVDLDARDRAPARVPHRADAEQGLARLVARHVGPQLQRRRVVRVERPQDRPFGRGRRLRVVYAVH